MNKRLPHFNRFFFCSIIVLVTLRVEFLWLTLLTGYVSAEANWGFKNAFYFKNFRPCFMLETFLRIYLFRTPTPEEIVIIRNCAMVHGGFDIHIREKK